MRNDLGRYVYQGDSGIRFERADLREGLGSVVGEPPFDIYFSSYGALSHVDREAVLRCLGDIVRHAELGATIVLDLLGRRSLEWPGYWAAPSEADRDAPLVDELSLRRGGAPRPRHRDRSPQLL